MHPTQQPIAIVGIATELPGGSLSAANLNYEEFFEFLCQKRESYQKIPLDRFDIDRVHGSLPGKINTSHGSFLKHLDLFDNIEFGISSRDAKAMSLDTRKLIELSFRALLDAGINYRGRSVGVYVAGDLNSTMTGLAGYPYMLANRISYHLDLTGPSLPLQTACSSTGVAMHLAIQDLLSGNCEAALVGGCQFNYRVQEWHLYSDAHILSHDGKCKPFDASADGFSRGEGAIVMVVKPLDAALRDGDHIYGTILGTGVTSGGSAQPVHAPVPEAQAAAMRHAFKVAGRSPSKVDFVELHATGTSAGDPAEANWVGNAFRQDDGSELLVGSVKGNVGHLEAVAFLTSLVKVLMAFENKIIPPTVNLSTANPAIRWNEGCLRVPTEPTPLPAKNGGNSLVSINSFGIGGVNVHAVVESFESYPHKGPLVECTNPYHLLLAGGLSPRTAATFVDTIQTTIKSNPTKLSQMSLAFGRRARQMTWRAFGISTPEGNVCFSPASLAPSRQVPVVFVFPGQGSQHINMGRELFRHYPVFRQTVLELDTIYRTITGSSLIQSTGLFDFSSDTNLLSVTWSIALILPSIAMFQIAIVDLLRSFGVSPDVVIGHSAGETTAMYACGSVSRDMAFEIAIARGLSSSIVEGEDRGMAFFGCSEDAVRTIVEQVHTDKQLVLDLACRNGRNAMVLSGHVKLLFAAMEIAKRDGVFTRMVRTQSPSHSTLMQETFADFHTRISDIFSRYTSVAPKVPYYSATTGKLYQELFSVAYLWTNTREVVRFSEAMTNILKHYSNAVVVEISPHPTLSAAIESIGFHPPSIMASFRRDREDSFSLLDLIGRLVATGYNAVDFHTLSGLPKSFKSTVELPPYPFQRKHYSVSPKTAFDVEAKKWKGILNHDQLTTALLVSPELVEHVIQNDSIMPATGYLEMIFEEGASIVWDVDFISVLALKQDKPASIEVICQNNFWSVRSSTKGGDDTSQISRTHARGSYSATSKSTPCSLDLAAIVDRTLPLDLPNFYEDLDTFAQYGSCFRRVVSLREGKDEWLVQIRGSDDLIHANQFIFHPALSDACLHLGIHPLITGSAPGFTYFLPSKVAYVLINRDEIKKSMDGRSLYCLLALRNWSPASIVYDVVIVNEAGTGLCEMHSLEIRRHYNVPRDHYASKWFHINHRVHLQLQLTTPEPSYGALDAEIIFEVGREFEMRDIIGKASTDSLWIQAIGDYNASAARGFFRTLNLELTHIRLHLVQFPPGLVPSTRLQYIAQLSSTSSINGELEFHVTLEGDVFVPRIEEAVFPKTEARAINSNDYWTCGDSLSIEHHPLPSVLPESHVVIKLSKIAPLEGPVAVAEAIVHNAGSGDLSIGTPVICVWKPDTTSNYLVVHEGQIARLSGQFDYGRILALLILTLSCPSNILEEPKASLKPIGVVGSNNSQVIRALIALLTHLKIDARLLSLDDPSTMLQISKQCSMILADCSSDLLNSLNIHNTPIFFWQPGITFALEKDLSFVREALTASYTLLEMTATDMQDTVTYLSPNDIIKDSPKTRALLLSPDKMYMVIGGVGSLGIAIAHWMYQNGARKIILTSRKGEASIASRSHSHSTRFLNYIRTLPGLTLEVRSCDATSKLDMEALMFHITSCLKSRIGGCVLASAVLWDVMFKSHTKEAYYAVFPPKVDAFKILEDVVDINSMDFLVNLSSVASLGSAGQTSYSSANSMLETLGRSYANTFSILGPAIIDTDIISPGGIPNPTYDILLPSSMTCEQLCLCIENGIRCLPNANFTEYIPNLDWNAVLPAFGSPRLYEHLLTKPATDTDNAEDYTTAILNIVCGIVEISPEELDFTVPITSYGLDSLSAGRMSTALSAYVKLTQVQLLGNISLNGIYSRLSPGAAAAREASRVDAMKSLVSKYSGSYSVPNRIEKNTLEKVVLLLGGTGGLGCHLLDQLIKDITITRVHVVVRGDNMKERQMEALRERFIDPTILETAGEKVVFLNEFSILSASAIRQLKESVTHVIYSAWRVDFNIGLSSYEENIKDLQTMINFCIEGGAVLVYMSSISVLKNIQGGPIKEGPVKATAAEGMGYPESKWVSEELIHTAQEAGLKSVIVRVGQLSGASDTGAWNVKEWVPAMMQAGLTLTKCFPQDKRMLSWLPIDVAASVLIEVLSVDEPPPILHLAHPKPVSWNDLASAIGLPLVSPREWLRMLKATGSDMFRAFRLLEFFESILSNEKGVEAFGFVQMGLEQMSTVSKVLNSTELQKLDGESVQTWIAYWEQSQFIGMVN